MGSPVLIASVREATKSQNKRLRRENKLPAVVYGKEYETKNIAVDFRELDRILRTHGETSLINLQVDDDTFPVLIKEVQRNTLKNTIDHVDFFKVSMDEEVEYNAPIVLAGVAEGVKMGGVLQHQKREVTLRALPRNMVDSVEVDISQMQIGDVVTVADLKVDSKNTLLDDPDEIIVSVVAPKLSDDSVQAPPEGAEPKLVENDDE